MMYSSYFVWLKCFYDLVFSWTHKIIYHCSTIIWWWYEIIIKEMKHVLLFRSDMMSKPFYYSNLMLIIVSVYLILFYYLRARVHRNHSLVKWNFFYRQIPKHIIIFNLHVMFIIGFWIKYKIIKWKHPEITLCNTSIYIYV